MTFKMLQKLQSVDIEKVDRASLVDIGTVSINLDAPLGERARDFFDQIDNPYAFRVGDYRVKVEFASGGISLFEALKNYIATERAGY